VDAPALFLQKHDFLFREIGFVQADIHIIEKFLE
jgi:hypothetical protein